MAACILIVDDSAVVRALHAYILRSVGFQTLEADNGFAALEALATHPCDLAVVDVNMPHMDGFTLIREIRATGATHALPVIIVSTEQEAHDKQKGFEAGANIYVVKPTEPEELVAHVRLLLGGTQRPARPARRRLAAPGL